MSKLQTKLRRFRAENENATTLLGCCRLSLTRYIEGDRPVPFSVGWLATMPGPVPSIPAAIASLRASGMTLAEIGDAVGLDGDTISSYQRGLRLRVEFSVGMRLVTMANGGSRNGHAD